MDEMKNAVYALRQAAVVNIPEKILFEKLVKQGYDYILNNERFPSNVEATEYNAIIDEFTGIDPETKEKYYI